MYSSSEENMELWQLKMTLTFVTRFDIKIYPACNMGIMNKEAYTMPSFESISGVDFVYHF